MKKSWFSKQIRVKHLVWLMAVLALVMISSSAIFYWWGTEEIKKSTVTRFYDQELVLARSGSMAIEDFFQHKKSQLLLLNQVPSVILGSEEGGAILASVAKDLEKEGGLVDVIARVDQSGIVVDGYRTNTGQKLEVSRRVSVADRDYFAWARLPKNIDQIFVSEPLLARGGETEGQWNLVMAAPLYDQKVFRGLLFISFPIQNLTEKFVKPLVPFMETEIFLVDQENNIIASSKKDMVGQASPDYLEETGLVNAKMVSAVSPIVLDNSELFLWISIPSDQIFKSASSIFDIETWGLILDVIGIVLMILVVIIGFRLAQRKAFVNGFRNGRDGIKKFGKKIKKG